jgi:LPS export ABC transporter protein LptC
MQQAKLIVIPAFFAIAIFLGVDYFDRAVEGPLIQDTAPGLAYNGYSEGINSVQFDEQGNIKYTLRASRQVSYVDAETSLEEPYIQLYRENDSHWNIIARSGRISAALANPAHVEEIVLSGGVEVYQMDRFGNRTVLSSETLTVETERDMLTTEASVTMASDKLEQTAVGMQIDLNSDEYVFKREIRGRYAAPQN